MKNSKFTLLFTLEQILLLQIKRLACGELVHFQYLAVPSVSIKRAVEKLGHAHFCSDIATGIVIDIKRGAGGLGLGLGLGLV